MKAQQERSVLLQFKNGNPFPYDMTPSAADLLLSLVPQCEVIRIDRHDGSFDVIWTQNIARITVGRPTPCEHFSQPISDGMISEFEP
jgi:hypothetical protein